MQQTIIVDPFVHSWTFRTLKWDLALSGGGGGGGSSESREPPWLRPSGSEGGREGGSRGGKEERGRKGRSEGGNEGQTYQVSSIRLES